MAVTKYTFAVAADVPQGVGLGNLTDEINASGSGIVTQIDYMNKTGDVLDIFFKDALSAAEETALHGDTLGPAGGLLAAHDPTLIDVPTPVSLDGVSKSSTKHLNVEVQPREGAGANFYTPNLCDQTTWYEGATEITEFAMTDSGNQILWNTGGTHPGPWVDLTHGKLFAEDAVAAANAALLVKVEVSTDGGTNWTVKTENTFDQTDGDYSVDYDNGTVSFNSALGGSDQVRVSFAKAAATLLYTIKPGTGKRLRIVEVETQMSTDCIPTDDVRYEVWAYDPNDLPNKAMVKQSVYKSISDFLYESNGVYPKFPAIAAGSPRGLSVDTLIVPFKYTASRDIVDSKGVEIRVTLNTPYAGSLVTSTFYCLEEDE
jgi:hypothetical protein